MDKQRLRREIKERLKLLPLASFHDEGLNAAAVLQNQSLFEQYSTVLIFLSTNNEVDTLPLIKAALAEGKKVFAPRVEGEKIQFYRILSTDGPWQGGPFGIREPVPGKGGETGRPLQAVDFPALVIVPGLAFTRQGKRLGYGGGYYDKFFAHLDEAGLPFTSLGFCMAEQVIEDLPTETWDREMDGVLTGRGLATL
ncbi:5-formyltetrahydrofolate cyclo-ligase [Leadbettera azotonutricia ZAS-9]|uniref:5-formyltetrahydrofolate cyclo-ligase n=1 Tax=Leadbettera azotonutricia (strain ATCC BAA-888 / DSM 13862 / ZAS-9) TaxID=545695 RepID=F5YAH9_LEAAZ|nr:5-formyltetrahydrofolate cyclo-ligase [Leadbettera azotonutricia ZAS-9]